jgi:hypothetical protein
MVNHWLKKKFINTTSVVPEQSTQFQPEDELEVEGIFGVNNDAGMGQEIEVHFLTINGEKFTGSITHQEAKHVIFKDCLEFGDFSNFGGARIGYRGAPTITFLLKSAINVDELYHLQNFDFIRKSSRQGRSHSDTIRCKIIGLRNQDTKRNDPIQHQKLDDGTRKVQIQGCHYRVPKATLLGFFACYGEVKSDIKEQLFDDGRDPNDAEDGINRSGNYIVKIKLGRDIPQFVPILGRRIKVHYPGIRKQSTNCFGPHPKLACQSRGLNWPDYVSWFAETNLEIDSSLVKRVWSSENRSQDFQQDQLQVGMDAQETVSLTEPVSIRDPETDPQIQMDTSSSSSTYTTEWVQNHQKKNRRQSEIITSKRA